MYFKISTTISFKIYYSLKSTPPCKFKWQIRKYNVKRTEHNKENTKEKEMGINFRVTCEALRRKYYYLLSRHPWPDLSRLFGALDSIYIIRVADGVETLLNHGYKIGNDILATDVICTPDTLSELLQRGEKLIEILLVFSL